MNTNLEHKEITEKNTTLVWYKQFWPWFLILLPSVTVVASMVTIYLAISHPDPIIKSDDQRLGPVLTRKKTGS